MSRNLPKVIQSCIDASHAHDAKAILACFADDAIVRDENATHRGKIDIERWVTTTIEKYKFQFKPLSSQERGNRAVVSVEISGTFPGSPITLDYHLTTANDKIASLSHRFLTIDRICRMCSPLSEPLNISTAQILC